MDCSTRKILVTLILLVLAGCSCKVDQINFPAQPEYQELPSHLFSNPLPVSNLGGKYNKALVISVNTGGYGHYLEFLLKSKVDEQNVTYIRVLPSEKNDEWQYVEINSCRQCASDSDYIASLEANDKGFYRYFDAVYKVDPTSKKFVAPSPVTGRLINFNTVMHAGKNTLAMYEHIGFNSTVHILDGTNWVDFSFAECNRQSWMVTHHEVIYLFCFRKTFRSNASKNVWSEVQSSPLSGSLIHLSATDNTRRKVFLHGKDVFNNRAYVNYELKNNTFTKILPGDSVIIRDVILFGNTGILYATKEGINKTSNYFGNSSSVYSGGPCSKFYRVNNSNTIFAFCWEGQGKKNRIFTEPKFKYANFNTILKSIDFGDSWSDVTNEIGVLEIP